MDKFKIFEKKYFLVITIAVVLMISGLTLYFWLKSANIFGNSQAEEAKVLVGKISQFLILPEDEEPTIATVSDPEVLKSQPFFAKAKKGDKVLIYAKTKKAILYNPETNKVIDIAPINLDQSGL